jgi:hypothetical protein
LYLVRFALSKRARRLSPTQGNDVTDFWRAGDDLRAWVSEALFFLLPRGVVP